MVTLKITTLDVTDCFDFLCLQPDMRSSISQFMANTHTSVNEMSIQYLQNERRYNYTTPKSFLEQIALYRKLLSINHTELMQKMSRLENGLEKLESTASQVDDLKAKLAAQEVDLGIKNEEANKLIQVVGAETEKVGKEKAVADEEEAKVTVINEEVSKKAADCERDLAKAEPALLAAQAALDTLNKNNLTELKSFGSPPAAVVKVLAAVMVLLANKAGKVPKDRSWKAAKGMMAKVDDFLNQLIHYDKENIPDFCVKAVQPYLDASILGRASRAGHLRVFVHDFRRFATDRHHTVDDRPFGGGPGMVLMCGPIFSAIEWVAGSCFTPGTYIEYGIQPVVGKL